MVLYQDMSVFFNIKKCADSLFPINENPNLI